MSHFFFFSLLVYSTCSSFIQHVARSITWLSFGLHRQNTIYLFLHLWRSLGLSCSNTYVFEMRSYVSMPYLWKYTVLVFGSIFQYCAHFLYFVHWVGCVWVLPVMDWWWGNSTGSSSWLLVDLYSGATSLKIGLVFCSRSCSEAIGQVCINSS